MSDTPEEKAKKQITEWTEEREMENPITDVLWDKTEALKDLISKLEKRIEKLEDKKDLDNSLDGSIGGISSLRIGKPKKNKWIKWDGGENPVPGKRVKIKFRAGDKGIRYSNNLYWSNTNSVGDIMKYRVID
jgi:hypothetical protein